MLPQARGTSNALGAGNQAAFAGSARTALWADSMLLWAAVHRIVTRGGRYNFQRLRSNIANGAHASI
jgi:hypothetical protein